MPCLSREYNVIGFSLEDCLVKFKTKQVVKLLTKCILTELIFREGYTSTLLNFDYEHGSELVFKNAIWDINHGTILRLAENQYISYAMLGQDRLHECRIKEIYGDPPIF